MFFDSHAVSMLADTSEDGIPDDRLLLPAQRERWQATHAATVAAVDALDRYSLLYRVHFQTALCALVQGVRACVVFFAC